MPLEPLCPDPATWRIAAIAPERDRLVFHMAPVRNTVACPVCGTRSHRVYSRYARKPWDGPWGQWPVQLIVHARRFFYDAPTCPRRIFMEPFPAVLAPQARQPERLRQVLLELAPASSMEMAARLAPWLGVDDFALRRSAIYGTFLVDLERRQPVAVLEERTAEPVLKWLQAHPSVAVLVRDRADAYALAGRMANPAIVQAADRFHPVRNVSGALQELLYSQRWQWPQVTMPLPPAASGPSRPLPVSGVDQGKTREATPWKRAAWGAVHQHHRAGRSCRQIARAVGLDRKTVRRYLAQAQPPVYPPRRARPTRLTPYLGYLSQRWGQGCQSAQQLYEELRQQGYRGGISQVRATVQPWRTGAVPSPQRPSLARLVLLSTRRLTVREREAFDDLLQVNPRLAQGYHLKERFQALLAQRDLGAFDQWLHAAEQSGLSSFQAVARGFRHDYEPIKPAFVLPWSTGQCEGQICRVKLIKRQGYGRAKLDLLPQRILHRIPAASPAAKQREGCMDRAIA